MSNTEEIQVRIWKLREQGDLLREAVESYTNKCVEVRTSFDESAPLEAFRVEARIIATPPAELSRLGSETIELLEGIVASLRNQGAWPNVSWSDEDKQVAIGAEDLIAQKTGFAFGLSNLTIACLPSQIMLGSTTWAEGAKADLSKFNLIARLDGPCEVGTACFLRFPVDTGPKTLDAPQFVSRAADLFEKTLRS